MICNENKGVSSSSIDSLKPRLKSMNNELIIYVFDIVICLKGKNEKLGYNKQINCALNFVYTH